MKIVLLLLGLVCSIWGIEQFRDSPAQRAQELLKQMTFDDKLAMVRGYPQYPYVGNVIANPRLKIPKLNLEDGPQGVADGIRLVTCWPSALTVVATWDVEMMHTYSAALADEQRKKGTNVMLGPMINIARVPMGGRNFESFGEDPYLASAMVAESVIGIQSKGVIAVAKHFVDNNQEYNRTTTSANVDQRTQWEIYYPAFQAAVDAGVGAIMCSYNRINDTWACENPQTLTVDLKGKMGFRGWVMSDWGATHTTVKAAIAGLDQQMPDDSFFGANLKQALLNNQVPMSRLDDMILRILTPMFAVGLFDIPQTGNLSVDVRSAEHTALARRLASAATVLAKNTNNILPLTSAIKKIAIIGDDGDARPIYSGGGSGNVIASNVVTPLTGIKMRAGSGVSVSYTPSNSTNQAILNAKSADVAIVFLATTSSEGIDRPDLSLGVVQTTLVEAVLKAQPRTIVVIHSPGAVLMPWAIDAAAILCAFLPGEVDGNAIADVLFGDVNPSGRLPVTFPSSQDQIAVNTVKQYPGIGDEAAYSEGLLVGYRWYDANGQAPLFPFGHGLSYTTFKYSDLKIQGSLSSGFLISVTITNTGKVAGDEVVQLYIGYPINANEPPQSLRGFKKIHLNPGQSRTIVFTLVKKDLSIWDVRQDNWVVVSGTFSVYIGASSRDIRVGGSFQA